MNVVLMGYRGTGKSSVGKKLSRVLRLPFYDTDTLIEKLAGKTIQEMVNEMGWGFFREKESEVIKGLAAVADSIIATGGGAVMDQKNVDVLKRNGVFVWLTADTDTIIGRMKADTGSVNKRPSFSRDALLKETVKTLEERMPVYRRLADFSIDTTDKGIDEIVTQICQFLEKRCQ
jgi:shikimate kinase